MNMFGAVVSGRLVQSFEQVGEAQFVTTIHDADNINHIVVFLTGTIPFPQGMGGLVYFSWPEPCAPPTWQLLGHLAEDKPSAIFKISSLKKGPLGSGDVGPNMNTFGGQLFSHNAQIGISVEPILQVQQQSALVTSQTTSNFMQFCQKMLENFLNYASSFGVTQAQMTPNPNETFIPLSVLQSWYNNFERRLQQNPNFWRT
ncbi:protein OPI10 homolog [Periplaneta americana]|uniref:protein OPI10 homolog n=1 Tax=Periplaneta americana TaxID=6978 RepID=UPI0037E90827